MADLALMVERILSVLAACIILWCVIGLFALAWSYV